MKIDVSGSGLPNGPSGSPGSLLTSGTVGTGSGGSGNRFPFREPVDRR